MNYGYGCGDPCYPSYGYPVGGYPAGGGCGIGSFALIIVLFILLIIIGASCHRPC